MRTRQSATGSLLLLLSIFLSCIVSVSHGATHYVEKWGSDSDQCKRSTPCENISHAIQQAKRNDRIIVGPGVYVENLVIDVGISGDLSGLKLESTAGLYATIIVAQFPGNPVIEISQPRVQIGRTGKGFTVTGALTTGAAGIEITDTAADRCKIEGNRASANDIGFILRGEKLQVRNNIVENNAADGFRCIGCDRALVRGNRVTTNAGVGVHMELTSKQMVQQNVISGNNLGLQILSSNPGAKIRDNVFERGSIVAGADLQNMDDYEVQRNISSRNVGSGLLLTQQTFNRRARAADNLIVGNSSQGMRLENLEDPRIMGNTTVSNNAEGFRFGTNVTGADFDRNNSFADDLNGSGCEIYSESIEVIVHNRHFFSAGTGVPPVCGPSPHGTTNPTNRPSPLRVSKARGLGQGT